MNSYPKDVSPKTTIWRNSPDGAILVETIYGLPNPIPSHGETVYIPGFGATICSGIACSGSSNTVVEVKLTLR